MKYYFAVLLLCLFVACDNSEFEGYENLPSLIVVDSLVLQLDSETPNRFASPQVVAGKNSASLINTFVSPGFVKFYDMNTGRCTNTIKFKNSGPQKINKLSGTYFWDSTNFVLIDGVKNIYSATNMDEIQINKIADAGIYKQDVNGSSAHINNTRHPVIKLADDKILVSNYWNFRKETKTFNIVDTIDKTLERVLDIPEEFVDGFYGAPQFLSWNYVYNQREDIIVANFPNQDSLYEYDLTPKLIRKHKVENSPKRKPIKAIVSLDWDETESDLDPQKVMFRVKSNMIYRTLLYDYKNNFYYRIVGHPITSTNLESNDPVLSEVRNYSIVVIDSNFQFVKEYIVPFNKYNIDYACYFIYDGYLYLQRFTDREDSTIFDKIKLI